jgi:hypothetical protein
MDVEIQMSLIAPAVRVVQSMDALADLVSIWYSELSQRDTDQKCVIQ